MADRLVKQIVVTHIYTWRTMRAAAVGVPAAWDHHRAYRGDIIEVSAEERDRGQRLGGLANPEDYRAGVDAVNDLSGPTMTDEELAASDAAELTAYVGQNPGEAQRVYEFEAARSGRNKPRVTVMAAAGYQPIKDDDGHTTGWEPIPDEGTAGVDETGAGPVAAG